MDEQEVSDDPFAYGANMFAPKGSIRLVRADGGRALVLVPMEV